MTSRGPTTTRRSWWSPGARRRPQPTGEGYPLRVSDLVFYDGTCGFCHRSVRFLVARDASGEAFRFAPLEGETLRARLSEEERLALPDSLAVMTEDGRLLTRSAAMVHVLRALGGAWAGCARLLEAVPESLRDRAYDAFARHRKRLFPSPEESCPVPAAGIRARFDP